MVTPRSLVHALLATIFTALFLAVGWQQINPYAFPDLANYRGGFQSGWYLFTTLNRTPIDFVLSEGVWVWLFDALYYYVGDIDTAFLVVSAASVFLMSVFVLSRTSSAWYLLFFINPAFINLTIEQIRSGIASGIFWTAVTIENRPIKIALMLLAGSIHTVFFLFAAFYAVYHVSRQTKIVDAILRKPTISFLILTIVAIIATIFRDSILAAFGDQRAYQFLEYTSGILLAIAWVSFAATYLLFRREDRFSFESALFSFNTVTALLSAVIGVYGSRFAAVAIPALAVMASRIPPGYRFLFGVQYALFSLLYFFFWFE